MECPLLELNAFVSVKRLAVNYAGELSSYVLSGHAAHFLSCIQLHELTIYLC